MELDLSKEDRYTQFSRDLFIFSYFSGGINFTDMANLKPKNIVNGRLIYSRQKTEKRINIPLNEKAMEIIQTYKGVTENSNYIFPILNETIHKTETQKYDRRKIVLFRVNRRLKKLSEKLGTYINLTTYVARHSYATENSQIDEAIKNLL